MLWSVPGADTVFRVGHGKIHIDAVQHTRVGHQRSWWIGRSPRVTKNWVVCDLSTGAVIATQSKKDSSVETDAAVAQTFETR